MHPTERLVNLVALLLDTPRPLTFERIRDVLPAYAQDDIGTAKRMFERDKDLLRDIGIPVDVVPTDAWEVEHGYTIPKDRYYLPEIEFSPEEISALMVAARSGGEDAAAEQAVRKLLFGVEGGLLVGPAGGPVAVSPDAGERLMAVADAVSTRRSIRFAYRTARGTSADRRIDPYGLVSRNGHWYVVGLDRDRGELRSFRLSRFQGDVNDAGEGSDPPEGFRAADHVQGGMWSSGEHQTRARVLFSAEVAWWATGGVPGAETLRTRRDGSVEAAVPLGSVEEVAGWVLSFGPEAKVLSPASLRGEVVRRLEAIIASV